MSVTYVMLLAYCDLYTNRTEIARLRLSYQSPERGTERDDLLCPLLQSPIALRHSNRISGQRRRAVIDWTPADILSIQSAAARVIDWSVDSWDLRLLFHTRTRTHSLSPLFLSLAVLFID